MAAWLTVNPAATLHAAEGLLVNGHPGTHMVLQVWLASIAVLGEKDTSRGKETVRAPP